MVEDVLCTSGPQDRPFEELHSAVCIAVIAAGTFQYRSSTGREMMTPGSLLLGTPGQPFECGHEHAAGDRCVSFRYDAAFFENAFAAAPNFASLRVPAIRSLSPLIARACSAVAHAVSPVHSSWEELSLMLAGHVLALIIDGRRPRLNVPVGAEARVSKIVRLIEQHPETNLSLDTLATESRLSRYHFIRTFEALTGLTPHQYVLRTRLREAAMRLAGRPAKILDIALDCGFSDVSNFNRVFRAEFGASPRAYRNGN